MNNIFKRNSFLIISVLIIFLGKLTWFLIVGIHYEPDSFGYVQLQADILHPPLYMIFLQPFLFTTGIKGAIVFQCLLFGIAHAWAIDKILKKKSIRIIGAILIAVEPASSLMCASVLAEALFIPILAIVAGYAAMKMQDEKIHTKEIFVFGILCSLAWYTRYAGMLLIPAVMIFILFRRTEKFSWRLVSILSIVFIWQVSAMPLRIYYKLNFGTFRLNVLHAYNDWNNTALLFPGSYIQKHPGNSFEKYLTSFPDSIYSLATTFTTNHINDDKYPLRSYILSRKLNTKQVFSLCDTVSGVSRTLFRKDPSGYIKQFVLLNIPRIFLHSQVSPAALADSWFKEKFGFLRSSLPSFRKEAWIAAFLLIIGASLFVLSRRKKINPLLTFCWIYFLVLPFRIVLFLRYFYIFGPLSILLFFNALEKEEAGVER